MKSTSSSSVQACGSQGLSGHSWTCAQDPNTLGLHAPRSSDLPGIVPVLPAGSLTLKVGRRMVFNMYRQKAMPRASCRTHAHLEENACSDSEL